MLPFEDIQVLDFSQRLPGPYCSSILADLGANVVVVERAGRIPETRSVFPGLFELLNRNKKSIALNLKSQDGKKVAEKLIQKADVVIEGFRPGVAERLGIGYKHAMRINPSIIYCSISGFGQDGPYRERVGHDINYLSLSGILSIPGQPDVPPSRPGVPMVDLASGMYGALAIMAALRRRDHEGVGTYLDVSMHDTMISWMSVRAGRLLVHGESPVDEHLSPLNNIYETKDGKKVSLGILEQHFWENFCDAIGNEELKKDSRFSSPAQRSAHKNELLNVIRKIISEFTIDELCNKLDWREVPYAPVYTIAEALEDKHVKARGILKKVEVDSLGSITEVSFPVKFSGFEAEIKLPPPGWGQHTEEILKDLGFSVSEIELLRKKKAI